VLELLSETHAPVGHILCLGAHCDDIEIGCGGTVLKLLQARGDVRVDWVVFTSDDERAPEARAGAAAILAGAGQSNVVFREFRQRYLPFVGDAVKEFFDELGASIRPDLIFTHYREDLHQDHRLLAELTYNTWRDRLILEYEIPKWDGDLGRPNVYVQLEPEQVERKVETIWEAFCSQHDKHWFTKETFLALMRLRGVECKAPSGYAEAFHCRKLVLL
jgi:LmbE family N-acetylglucosaminyl deacetylase